eukprot:jgi/Mesvir1/28310/Mv04830-RA.1
MAAAAVGSGPMKREGRWSLESNNTTNTAASSELRAQLGRAEEELAVMARVAAEHENRAVEAESRAHALRSEISRLKSSVELNERMAAESWSAAQAAREREEAQKKRGMAVSDRLANRKRHAWNSRLGRCLENVLSDASLSLADLVRASMVCREWWAAVEAVFQRKARILVEIDPQVRPAVCHLGGAPFFRLWGGIESRWVSHNPHTTQVLTTFAGPTVGSAGCPCMSLEGDRLLTVRGTIWESQFKVWSLVGGGREEGERHPSFNSLSGASNGATIATLLRTIPNCKSPVTCCQLLPMGGPLDDTPGGALGGAGADGIGNNGRPGGAPGGMAPASGAIDVAVAAARVFARADHTGLVSVMGSTGGVLSLAGDEDASMVDRSGVGSVVAHQPALGQQFSSHQEGSSCESEGNPEANPAVSALDLLQGGFILHKPAMGQGGMMRDGAAGARNGAGGAAGDAAPVDPEHGKLGLFLSGHSDGRVRLWDIATGNLVRVFASREQESEGEAIHAVTHGVSGKLLLVYAATASGVLVWDYESGQNLYYLIHPSFASQEAALAALNCNASVKVMRQKCGGSVSLAVDHGRIAYANWDRTQEVMFVDIKSGMSEPDIQVLHVTLEGGLGGAAHATTPVAGGGANAAMGQGCNATEGNMGTPDALGGGGGGIGSAVGGPGGGAGGSNASIMAIASAPPLAPPGAIMAPPPHSTPATTGGVMAGDVAHRPADVAHRSTLTNTAQLAQEGKGGGGVAIGPVDVQAALPGPLAAPLPRGQGHGIKRKASWPAVGDAAANDHMSTMAAATGEAPEGGGAGATPGHPAGAEPGLIAGAGVGEGGAGGGAAAREAQGGGGHCGGNIGGGNSTAPSHTGTANGTGDAARVRVKLDSGCLGFFNGDLAAVVRRGMPHATAIELLVWKVTYHDMNDGGVDAGGGAGGAGEGADNGTTGVFGDMELDSSLARVRPSRDLANQRRPLGLWAGDVGALALSRVTPTCAATRLGEVSDAGPAFALVAAFSTHGVTVTVPGTAEPPPLASATTLPPPVLASAAASSAMVGGGISASAAKGPAPEKGFGAMFGIRTVGTAVSTGAKAGSTGFHQMWGRGLSIAGEAVCGPTLGTLPPPGMNPRLALQVMGVLQNGSVFRAPKAAWEAMNSSTSPCALAANWRYQAIAHENGHLEVADFANRGNGGGLLGSLRLPQGTSHPRMRGMLGRLGGGRGEMHTMKCP